MNVPFFISERISFRGKAAISSIAVSFLTIIVAAGISEGFRKEIRNALSSLCGDITVMPVGIMEDNPHISSECLDIDGIRAVDGVSQVREVVYDAGIIKKDGEIYGVIFKGVHTCDSASMKISVPRSLARKAGCSEGDRMLSFFVGDNVIIRNFTVDSIYEDISTGDGRMMVICDIEMLRRVKGWDKSKSSAIELRLDERHRNESASSRVCDEIAGMLYEQCGESETPLYAATVQDQYSQMFDWLRLIDANTAFILLLMIIVAGFNMVSGLLILLFENIRTIGILKSVGMQTRKIAETFLFSSARLVLTGMLVGNILGTGVCLVLGHTRLLKLDPSNYFIDHVPASIDVSYILGCDTAAFIGIMLILLIPCAFISSIDPAESVRVR